MARRQGTSRTDRADLRSAVILVSCLPSSDPRVTKAESDQIVDALQARGVDVRYDVYDDEGHGFTKRANQVQAMRDVVHFLLTHLN